MLGSYFLCIDISYEKTQFTCDLIDLSELKIIVTSEFVEDIKITHELFKKS